MAAAHGVPKTEPPPFAEPTTTPPVEAGAAPSADAPLVENDVLVLKARTLAAELRSLLRTTRRLANEQDRLIAASRGLRRPRSRG